MDDEQQLLQVAPGKVVTQWPSGNLLYRVLTKVLGRVSETTRSTGERPVADRPAGTVSRKVAFAADRPASRGARMPMSLDIDPLDLVDPERFALNGYPARRVDPAAGRGAGGLLRAARVSAVLGGHQARRRPVRRPHSPSSSRARRGSRWTWT